MDPLNPPQPTTQPVATPTVTPPTLAQPVQTPNTPKKKSKLGLLISLLIILFLLCISGAAGYTIYKNLNSNKGPVETACTLETMVCPDGSSVGRSGPNCEFTPCPTPAPDPTENWKTYKGDGFSFRYPNDFAYEKCPQGFGSSQLCTDEQDQSSEPLFYYVYVSKEITRPTQYNFTTEIINGQSVYKTTEVPSRSGALSVYYKKNDSSYISISLTPYDKDKPFLSQDKFYSLFDQILFTFKFTE